MFAALPLFPPADSPPRPALDPSRAEALAGELTHALDSIFGPSASQYDPALDLPALRSDLRALLALAPIGHPEADAAASLVAFHRVLASRHALAPSTWTLLLDRAASHPALADHPLALAAPLLINALPRLPYLRALAGFFNQLAGPAPALALAESALALHALLAAAPGSAPTLRVAAAIEPASAPCIDSLDTNEAALVARLRADLEQTGVDEALAGLAWLRRLRAAPALLENADPLFDSAVRSALAPEGSPPAALFRLRLVGRHRQNTPEACDSLSPLAAERAAALPTAFAAARPALRSLNIIARDLAEWPETLLAETSSHRAAAYVADVLLEEHRLRRPAAARAVAFRRLALDFARETATPLAEMPAVVEHLASLPAWQRGEPAAALSILRASCATLRAASTLLASHAAIGADAARRAYAAQPDYAAKTGPSGEKACGKDNGLTLRQLALLLLDGQPQPAERLQEWWSATVGVHIVNRPPHLFVQNLRSLHAALRHALPPEGLDAVFPPLHQLYKEAIGVPDSPLLHFGAYPAPALPAIAPARFAGPAFLKAHLKRVSALVEAPPAFVPAWTAWLENPAEDSLAALALAQGAEPVLRATALLLGDALRANPAPADDALSALARLPARLAVRQLADHLEKTRSEATKGERDLALTHAYLAEQLRLRPLESAVLQTSRFLLELVGPHLVEGPAELEKNIQAARSALASDCPALARPLLDLWFAQLVAIGPRLCALRPFLQLAYPSGHPALDRAGHDEKNLRGALTSVLLPSLATTGSAPWPGVNLAAAAPSVSAGQRERLVAFLDTLFDQLDGTVYYDLLALVGEPSPASEPPCETTVLPPPASPRRAALTAAPPKAGLLGGLFGAPPAHLAHDLAIAAALSPGWLAPLLPAFAPEAVRAQAEALRQTWSNLTA